MLTEWDRYSSALQETVKKLVVELMETLDYAHSS